MNASAAASLLNLDLFSMDIQRREQHGLKDRGNFPLSTLKLQVDARSPRHPHADACARAYGMQKHAKSFRCFEYEPRKGYCSWQVFYDSMMAEVLLVLDFAQALFP